MAAIETAGECGKSALIRRSQATHRERWTPAALVFGSRGDS
ncbi:hypothetical protein RRSWK_03078 [Rhodopirellula sp. SWK7]|nr:hypothetical protein RRSWK_03078 [Rhodopirellula sp. SWK7]